MSNKLPSLNSVRIFEAAARHSSFKNAAIELNVTATAVSHQIRNLENHLGVTLFDRKSRVVELTIKGRELSVAASQALQIIEKTVGTITSDSRVLTVSTTASFAAAWLVPHLENFYSLYPDIQVVIETGEHVEDLTVNQRVDLAIRYGDKSSHSELESHVYIPETFGMYATPEYLETLTTTRKITLIETQWKNTSLPEIGWSQWLGQLQNAHPNTTFSIRKFNLEHHSIEAALAGQGIVLVSSLLIETALKNNWLVEYSAGVEIPGLDYYLVLSNEDDVDRKVTVFKEWIVRETSM